MKMSQFDLISTPSGNSTDYMKSGEIHQSTLYSMIFLIMYNFQLQH